MKLTDTEKVLMQELSRNPVFTGLLQRISAETRPVPRYDKKPGDETAKVHGWINSSGFVEGKEFVLKLLRNKDD